VFSKFNSTAERATLPRGAAGVAGTAGAAFGVAGAAAGVAAF